MGRACSFGPGSRKGEGGSCVRVWKGQGEGLGGPVPPGLEKGEGACETAEERDAGGAWDSCGRLCRALWAMPLCTDMGATEGVWSRGGL